MLLYWHKLLYQYCSLLIFFPLSSLAAHSRTYSAVDILYSISIIRIPFIIKYIIKQYHWKLMRLRFVFRSVCEISFFFFALVVWGIRIQPTFALVRVVKGD